MKRTNSMLIALILTVAISNCSHYTPLGEFTVASTNNVRNLDYEIGNEKGIKTTGKSTARYFLGSSITSDKDLLQKAMDKAIDEGRESGIDGDLLVNVRIEQGYNSFLGFEKITFKVTGDLVKLTDK